MLKGFSCHHSAGFVQQPTESASCMMLLNRAPMTADLACTLAHQKPYVTCKWYTKKQHLLCTAGPFSLSHRPQVEIVCRLQAIIERPSLSDPPAQMADFKPLIYTACSPQGLHLPLIYNQHLLSEFGFTMPSKVALVSFCAKSMQQDQLVCQHHLCIHESLSKVIMQHQLISCHSFFCSLAIVVF